LCRTFAHGEQWVRPPARSRASLLTEPGGSGQGPVVHRVNIVIKGQRRRATGPPLGHVHSFQWQLLWPFCGRTISGSLGLHR
jgi:hypothetical protein